VANIETFFIPQKLFFKISNFYVIVK